MWDLALATFITLIVVVDPIAISPIFISLTHGLDQSQKRGVALRAVLIAGGMLTLFGLGGETLLKIFGIGMPAFRISGGILLFLTAIEMLFGKRTPRREQSAGLENFTDPSVFPLAVPLLAGPGSIATVILIAGQHIGEPTEQLTVFAVLLGVLLLTYITFIASGYLARVLGTTVINVITRIFGMLLAALAVQFVLDGLRDYGMVG